MTRVHWFVTVVTVLSSWAFTQQGHVEVPRAGFVLNVDYARFLNDDRSGYLEVYYSFYPKLVSLETVGDRFVGGVQLYTWISNAKTGELYRNERGYLSVVAVDTSDDLFRRTLITQAGYALPFGEYRLSVLAVDSLTPSRRDSIDIPFQLVPYGAGVAVSDIELCSEIKSSDAKSDPFYKNSLEVVPNPSLTFGVTTYPVVFNYAELYNLDIGKTYSLKTQILDASSRVVRETSRPKRYGVQNAVEVGTTNVSSLASGRYRFVLILADGSGKEVGRSEKTFFIYNPHVQPEVVTSAAIKANEMAGLTADELAAEFRQAQYVSTDAEKRMFEQLTGEEARRNFLAQFWVEVEKGRLGMPAMRRIDYLQRVSTANQRYRSYAKEGWRTDRGRVYILYGDPDEVERFPSETNTKPYEIWRYYGIESGVEFVFVDRSGFSEYVLVHSTKRGELRDEQWQRYLQ